ncbi:hypothetical protein [Dysgonomonas termitidis]|uniref:Tetratricopeptide repeat protein n=1 Tax=Dysgonomonas termitidis TaxID=1516126 RepID=A0ABV9KX12_9BACT
MNYSKDTESYERAVADAKKGNYNDALDVLKKLYQDDPGNNVLIETAYIIFQVKSIRRLFIFAIVFAVIVAVFFGYISSGGTDIFSGIWLGSGLGCAAEHYWKHGEWWDDAKNDFSKFIRWILFFIFLFGGPVTLLIRYLLKRKYIQELKNL